jgi:hypothetical protein
MDRSVCATNFGPPRSSPPRERHHSPPVGIRVPSAASCPEPCESGVLGLAGRLSLSTTSSVSRSFDDLPRGPRVDSGSRAVSTAPPSSALSIRRRPPSASTWSAMPTRPWPSGVRPADSVVVHLEGQDAVIDRSPDRRPRRLGMLDDVPRRGPSRGCGLAALRSQPTRRPWRPVSIERVQLGQGRDTRNGADPGTQLCPTTCPTGAEFPMVKPNQSGIISARVSRLAASISFTFPGQEPAAEHPVRMPVRSNPWCRSTARDLAAPVARYGSWCVHMRGRQRRSRRLRVRHADRRPALRGVARMGYLRSALP